MESAQYKNEIIIIKELHNDQEYHWLTIYSAEAAVVSTITHTSLSDLIVCRYTCNKHVAII